MKNRRKMARINNVEKPAPSVKLAAEGSEIYTTNGLKWTIPSITTSLIEQYADNALLKEPVENLKNLIFRGEAQVSVYDEAGETDTILSEKALKLYRDLDLYAAHQIAFTDIIFGGCSVFSYGPDPEQDNILVFKNLPWNSFRELPSGFMDIYNDIMPGIVIDKATKKKRVFQKQDDRNPPVEITNFAIIKDPTSPKPAGKPDCLPVIPLITNYNYADKAMNQKMNRTGAPPIFPYVEKITPGNKTYVEALAKRWGKDTAFIMTEGMDFRDPKIIETTTAEERLSFLKKRIDGYFNPSTFVQKDGNTIGGSDSGAMELIYNYIDKTLTMLEIQINQESLKKWLDEDGYTKLGYYAEIKHPRPSVKKDAQILAEIAELAKNGAITPNEQRQNAPNLDLADLTPEELAVEQERIKARQPTNPFGNLPVGNLQGNPRARLMKVEKTQAYQETEASLIAARRKFADAILKGLENPN